MSLRKIPMIAALAIAALATPALAQQSAPHGPPCAGRDHVTGQLREVFGERLVGSGLAESGVLFELHVGPNGSWTLLATKPDGASCLVGAGESWEPVPDSDVFAAR